MFSDTQIFALFGAFIAVIVTHWFLTNRKLNTILRYLPTSSTTAPLPADDMRIILGVSAAVLALIFALLFIPDRAAVSSWAVHLGLVANDTRPLGQWQTSSIGRYQWHAFDLENVTRYPIIECALFDRALDLQETLLGPVPLMPPRGTYDHDTEDDLRKSRLQEERLRTRARKRCVLPPPHEHVTLDPRNMQYLTDPRQPSLVVPLQRALEHDDDELLEHAKVRHILQARDGSRFYSVLMAVPNQTHVLPTELRVEQRIVSEEDLLRAPRDWYFEYCSNAGFSATMACVCPAQFGLFDTGLYFHYEPSAVGASSNLPRRCQGQWRLWMHSRIVRVNTQAEIAGYRMEFQELGTGFPFHVNAKLNISTFLMGDIQDIEYLDIAAAADTPVGHMILEEVHPGWLAPSLPVVNRSSSPLLSIVPVAEFMKRAENHVHSAEGNTNLCFSHCLHVDQMILQQVTTKKTGTG